MAVFAFGVSIVIPVSLASSQTAGPSDSPGGRTYHDVPYEPGTPPLSDQQLDQAATDAAAEEAARETAQGQEYRENSVDAFADLGPSESADLVAQKFDRLLAGATEDPASALQDVDGVRAYRGETMALVDPAGPETHGLLVSTVPLRTDEGELPDLDLARTGGEVVPEEPLAEVSIPDELSAGAALDAADVGIKFAGAAPADPDSRLISTSGSEADKEAVFYPEALTDTDMLMAPVANGLETFAQIRSKDSPEQLRLHVDVPEGGRIVPNEIGGAMVLDSSDKPVVSVEPPFGEDAQGAQVPVTLEVKGTDIVLDVPHRGADHAYPILVDPLFQYLNWYEYGYEGAGSIPDPYEAGWVYNSNGWSNYVPTIHCADTEPPDPIYWDCEGPLVDDGASGMYIYAPWHTYYPGNSSVQWVYTIPGASSYISTAWVTYSRYWRAAGSGSTPYGYGGLSAPGYWTSLGYYYDNWVGSWTLHGAAAAKTAIFGMGAGYTLQTGPYYRYLRVGNITMEFGDGENPTLQPISAPAASAPSETGGWLSSGDEFDIPINASDNGLGIKQVVASAPNGAGGTAYQEEWSAGCIGTRPDPCPSATPANAAVPDFGANGLAEGESTLTVQAYDALGKSAQSAVGTRSFPVKVDRIAPPEIELSDQLAVATNEVGTTGDQAAEDLSLPRYQLDITAEDNDPTNAQTPASGISRIEVLAGADQDHLEPVGTPTTPSCSATSCPQVANATRQINLFDLDPGRNLIRVKVFDLAGNERKRDVEIDYAPATGVEDEFVMQYAQLPDGSELAVNVANGNLVYRTKDVEVVGQDVDLELERYYNSQLPESEDSEWGDGWTLAQTPELTSEDGEQPPDPQEGSVELTGETGNVDGDLPLGPLDEENFDPELQGGITEVAEGGYELDQTITDETVVFNEQGIVEEVEGINASSVDYGRTPGDLLAEIETEEMNPAAETSLNVSHDGDLVSEVEGAETGEHSYEHDPEGNLTTHESPDGETVYTYDDAGNLTGMDLADGTAVTIDYEGADEAGRVTSLTVDPSEGDTETTSFSYSDQPRLTTVSEPTGGVTEYKIAADGSILTSKTGATSMQLTPSGDLYAASDQTLTEAREYSISLVGTGGAIDTLEIDVEGIVVAEFKCPEAESPCSTLTGTWNAHRDSLAYGVNNFEVFAIAANGDRVSERFSVLVPPPPPVDEDDGQFGPPPIDVARDFRERFGMQIPQPELEERQIDDDYWGSLGEYGVPLSASEYAEMKDRESDFIEAEALLRGYGEEHPDVYAGYYVQNELGGKIRVGFTDDAEDHLDAVKAEFSSPERLDLFEVPPDLSLAAIDSLADQINTDARSGSIPGWVGVVAARVDEVSNAVTLLLTTVDGTATSYLEGRYGSSLDFLEALSGEDKKKVKPPRLKAGDRGYVDGRPPCTHAFGARDPVGTDRGRTKFKYFLLTAGHCTELGSAWKDPYNNREVGKVVRRYQSGTTPLGPDVAAIRLDDPAVVPRTVVNGTGKTRVLGVHDAGCWPSEANLPKGMPLKMTGTGDASQETKPGEVDATIQGAARPDGPCASQSQERWLPMVVATYSREGGDSGGPVFSRYRAVGIHRKRTNCVHADQGECALFTPVRPTAEWLLNGVLGTGAETEFKIFTADMEIK